jgi:hypothetical protein
MISASFHAPVPDLHVGQVHRPVGQEVLDEHAGLHSLGPGDREREGRLAVGLVRVGHPEGVHVVGGSARRDPEQR